MYFYCLCFMCETFFLTKLRVNLIRHLVFGKEQLSTVKSISKCDYESSVSDVLLKQRHLHLCINILGITGPTAKTLFNF